MGNWAVGIHICCVLYFLNDKSRKKMEVDTNIEKLQKIKNSEINKALGFFILFFGFVIIIATFFTTTFIGQMTNLFAGVVLTAIGGGMVIIARIKIKKINI